MKSTDNAASASAQGGLEALVACLEDEYRALLADDHEQLDAVLVRKQQLLSQLASQPGFGQPQGDPARARSGLQALERVRQLTHRNAITLAPRLLANGARLRFLQAAMGQASVYTADGSVSGARSAGGAYRMQPRGA